MDDTDKKRPQTCHPNGQQVPNPPCITLIGTEKTLQGFPLMQRLLVLLDHQSYCVRHPTHCKKNNSKSNYKQFFFQTKFPQVKEKVFKNGLVTA